MKEVFSFSKLNKKNNLFGNEIEKAVGKLKIETPENN